MKKIFIWLMKAFVSGLVALGIATGFCFFYYNFPSVYVNETGATDYVVDANHISIRGTEGFAYTKTDEYGFVNTFPDKKDSIDVLVMGSSHTQGLNVDADENFTYVLNKKLKENGYDKFAYSIGSSGHNLIVCLRNLENAIKVYQPEEYVVVEASAIDFDVNVWEQLNNGTHEKLTAYDSGVMLYLKKFDFVRLAISQVYNFVFKDSQESVTTEEQTETSEKYLEKNRQLVETAIRNASTIAEKNNCKLVIIYSPQIEVDYYGDIVKEAPSFGYEIFRDACEKYNVEFVDMFDTYEKMYEESNRLPNGFSNSAIGKGHINKYGHNCIGNKLYDTIVEE
ncbi:MAG: hypothetical protein IKK46_01480 [Clostridia bacterium]|nr:hypothetical protein [Clostridia bacterium]